MKIPISAFTGDPGFPFYIQYGKHESEMYIHSHDNYSELVIVMEGSADHYVDGETRRISKGDVFVISNNTEHGYTEVKDFQICNIMFRPSFVFSKEIDIFNSEGFQALFVLEPQYIKENSFKSRLRLDTKDFVNVCRIIENIYAEYYSESDGRKTIVISEFMRLCVTLSRLYSFDPDETGTSLINLAKAVTYIEKNFDKKISTGYLAKLSNYSLRQFLRVFKRAYGLTPTDYIMNIRIKNACRLLRASDYPITQIALSCGFCDSNYFSRAFKKEKKLSPTQYRADKKIY